VDEIGAGEPDPARKRMSQRQALHDDGGHRQAEEGEPGQSDEVDPFEHGDPRDCNRPESHDAGQQSRDEGAGAPGRHPNRADVGRAEDEGPDDDPVTEPQSPVEEGGSDRVRRRGEAKREAAPEPPSVQLDRLGDELADRSVRWMDGGLDEETLAGEVRRQRRGRFTRTRKVAIAPGLPRLSTALTRTT
jgi:hypothetical protein